MRWAGHALEPIFLLLHDPVLTRTPVGPTNLAHPSVLGGIVYPIAVGLMIFLTTFGGALLGMWSRDTLPDHHLDDASKDTIKLSIGLVATMTALILGLITSSAKNTYDAADAAVKESSSNVMSLDRLLVRYGSETRPIRRQLQALVKEKADIIWQRGDNRPALDPMYRDLGLRGEVIADAILALQPRTDRQKFLQSQAESLAESVLQGRWQTFIGVESSVPVEFLGILGFWLTVTFWSFGLFAPRNPTVITVLCVSCLSVGGALFIVLELEHPLSGLIRVSGEPLHQALESINGNP